MPVLQGGVSKTNVGSSLSNVASGALAGSSFGGIGALVGAGVGLLGSLFGNKGSSAETMSMQDAYNLEMYNTMKDLYMMNQQNMYNERNLGLQAKYNAESEARQFNYQSLLADKSFEQNKWFVQNAYQNTVQDLYKAGINPLLAINQGSNVGSVGMGSATALSAGLPSASISSGSGVDPSSLMTASANSANAKTARQQLAYNLVNTMSDVIAKTSASAKALEEAKTQESVRNVNESQVLLNDIREKREQLQYNLDQKYGDRDRQLQQMAVLNDMEYKVISAESGRIAANAQQISAKATESVSQEDAKIKAARAKFIEEHPFMYNTQQLLDSIGNIGLIGAGIGMSKLRNPGIKRSDIKRLESKGRRVNSSQYFGGW